MSPSIVRSDVLPGVALLSIHRPARLNALDGAAADDLREAILSATSEPAIHAVVVRGEGKAFSTGLDLTDVDPQATIDLGAILERHFEPLIEVVRSAGVPVVAAVNGPAAGVSVALALAADLCIASDAAYFLLPFTGLGLVPDGGLTWLLPRLAGAQRAAAAALLGERIGAATAADWGLIWKCVPAAEFDAAVAQCAQRLAGLPRAALGATKRALIEAQSRGFDAHLLAERELQQSLGRTPEFRERLLRFLAR